MIATCIRYHGFGSPQDLLQVEDKQIQPPMNGEILVRMVARPINPSDLIPIRGAYSHRISLPTIPGYEGVGIVEEVGPSVPKELLGKRVLPLRGEGTWQDYVTAPAELAISIPTSMEDYIAAQLYINPITAWVICTEILRLKDDDILLVNACGSSIGRIFCQLSTILGFRLIAVTRSNTYTEELLQLGASSVINTSDTVLHHTVMELTNGRGATAAIDSVGGAAGSDLAFCVRPNGTLVTIGLLSGVPVHWGEISRRSKVNIKLFHLRHWNQQVSVQAWQDTFSLLLALLMEQKLALMMPYAHYDLFEVQEAIRVAESSRNRGKFFLT
ncbi:zinc-dependent alcohol dehydrogenase family protein [Brevibacillus laterosporus]|uniref:zinc-dependent alcohol dehydrogenase family protein n=1 Tax=Brevibacillus laterosporus TaxID=1465 RepID=UPI00037A0BCA|nr:zinc-dependent alcohol dehydrogenase family protein [Brevibacillus laterosporus]ATO47762.1 alcohol dehydrogenase [Brevibacillus laterosporus DSM 25]MBG9804838.1 alcohol dehydrogenase [Brevibacillus laterosporus]MED2002493.1 zinc-dependent alcohol dehydrogenase family protein [Brevibacillus laterosporus]MED4761886.1 zinc-dependent alcohol dehydrogenase family protein [Brevibacillus laterosporus]TPH22948.1 alcohol dehydrogenase [Brevibacillus laterosporus]